MKYSNDIKELYEMMKQSKLKGNFSINNECLIWNISPNVYIKILIGGHGGDDCIVYYAKYENEDYYVTTEDFNTRNNVALLNMLEEINNSKNYIICFKGMLKLKWRLLYNKIDISKYKNSKKYIIFRF